MTIAKLARLEILKTRKRFAFGASLLVFFGMMTIGTGGSYLLHRRTPGLPGVALPDGWDSVISPAASFGALVLTVMVVLLVASEKSWRTERQNVIDGLSRTQYFGGKLLLVLLLTLLLWAGTLLLGLLFGTLTRQITPADAPLIDALSLRMIGGFLLSLLVSGTIALFFAMVASGSGAALALAFVFMMAQPMVQALLTMRGGAWRALVPYFPTQVLGTLTSRAAHGGATRNIEFGFAELPLQRALLVAILYGILFAAGAWASVRTRDL